eukprot:TRINITY_DN112791_c0_g1_i1.p1 TRINITY_DN112791_c0_g1~~TRINITY_DN112791_c0_g1_i1.p1  ORF type:complete len:601 (-),score=91.63 TRINITY_DN112791_c0_g1_i1:269-2005(-)
MTASEGIGLDDDIRQQIRQLVERQCTMYEELVTTSYWKLADQHRSEYETLVASLLREARREDKVGPGQDAAQAVEVKVQEEPVDMPSVQRVQSVFNEERGTESVQASFVTSHFAGLHLNEGFEQDLARIVPMSIPGADLIRRFLMWVLTLQEPERQGFLYNVLNSKFFEVLCSAIIFLNTIIIYSSTNAGMRRAIDMTEHDLTASAAPVETKDWQADVELIFTAFYTCELAVRLIVHRWFFFYNEDAAWNCLDGFLVAVSIFELLSQSANTSVNLMFLRVLRVLKVTKLLRLVRAIRFLSEVRLMAECLKGSLLHLFWGMIMVLMILLVFALFFVQAVSGFIETAGDGPYENGTTREELVEHFGTVEGTMLVLYMLVTGSDWLEPYRIVSSTGPVTAFVLIAYMTFFTVAVWNIVASVFIENTMKMALPDREEELLEKHRQDVQDAKKLMQICTSADTDESGRVSISEFQRFMDDRRFRDFLELRGLDIKDTSMFFNMMTTSTGCSDVHLDSFVASCLKVRGTATSIDLQALAFETRCMHQKHKQFFSFVEARLEQLEGQFVSLFGTLCQKPLLHVEI